MHPLYVAEVSTKRGPLLRLYEFDRESNSTFQIDLFASADTPAFWIHCRLANTMPRPISAYWWTNVGHPMLSPDHTRVLAPVDYIIAGGMQRAPFPHSVDADPTGMAGQDAWPRQVVLASPATDHSYPNHL